MEVVPSSKLARLLLLEDEGSAEADHLVVSDVKGRRSFPSHEIEEFSILIARPVASPPMEQALQQVPQM